MSFFFFYSKGDSTSGQRAIYHSLGLTGIPIINVNNNCATGSTALFLAGQVIKGGKLHLLTPSKIQLYLTPGQERSWHIL